MADPRPTETTRASRRIPPLFWLILALIVICLVWAFVSWRGTTHTPHDQMPAPQQQPAGPTVMPRQSNVPNTPQPSSGATSGAGQTGSPNEPGGATNGSTGPTPPAGGNTGG